MNSVLFVDDDQNVLAGIKRMLRPLRNDFDFFFADCGPKALEIMAADPIDIVVSDMRMPGMSGLQLLDEIQQRYPRSIRIMLSGQADEAAILGTVSVIHQFLSKPCEPEKLKDVLTSSAALYNLLDNEHLKGLISGIGKLPSLPSIYAKLNDAFKDKDILADDVAKIIEQDIAMTAKVLQLVNSSFFGLYSKVESTSKAVKLLGIETVKTLVLGAQIFSELHVKSAVLNLDELYEHSMAVGNCTKIIAREFTDDKGFIEKCFIAGLLHDIGKLLLITQCQKQYEAVIEESRVNGLPLLEVEYKQLQSCHGFVGAYLIGLWGFNAQIVESVAFHNTIASYPATGWNPALFVHIADCTYYEVFPEKLIGVPPVLDETYIENLGLLEEAHSLRDAARVFYARLRDG